MSTTVVSPGIIGLTITSPLSISLVLQNANVRVGATDAELRDRSTHTGTQLSNTISDLVSVIDTRISAAGGGSDKHYAHTQSSASSVWNITHNLVKFPSIQVFDSAGTEVVGDITHLSVNSARIQFTVPFSGVAYCN